MTLRAATYPILVLALAAIPAFAQGLIIPIETDLPPLALESHQVAVSVDGRGATTSVEQVFRNHTDRQLEAQYVFPVPRGAVVTRFTLLVNGVETEGEILEKTEARRIYNQIVNRAQDPGLLEFLGSDLFRASIFPIPPNGAQKITLRYGQVLTAEGGLVHLEYPVRSTKKAPTVHGEFGIEVALVGQFPIQNIYSPSHAVIVERAGDKAATIRFESKGTTIEKDFHLYWSEGTRPIGLDLMTYRPEPEKPGTFALLISPIVRETAADQIVARDLVFVVDVSGSMAGEKIEQARKALAYMVAHTNDGDRFNIVLFSTEVEAWKKELVGAKESRQAALAFADTLLAQGGTNIAEALETALSFHKDPSRPYYVIFMTDGKPTLGPTVEAGKILERVRAHRDGSEAPVRIFSWGVGYDVDATLVDGIASTGGGASEYVRPDEDIAARIGSFYAKTSHPVLTDIQLRVVGEKVQLLHTYPRTLPDLFAGAPLVLVGQYTGEGEVAIELVGRVNEKTEKFTYETTFGAASRGPHAFLEALWAQRRIGHLLEEIRLHGETKELVDDVVRLSIEFGVPTPYTSYLVVEDGSGTPGLNPTSTDPRTLPGPTAGGAGGEGGRWGAFSRRSLGQGAAEAEDGRATEEKLHELARQHGEPAREATSGDGDRGRDAMDAAKSEFANDLSRGLAAKDGKAAVETARYLQSLKGSETGGAAGWASAAVRRAGSARFVSYQGIWVDDRFDSSATVTVVEFGSEAYFAILDAHPELLEPFQLGTRVLVVTGTGKALLISSDGQERLTESTIEDLFAR